MEFDLETHINSVVVYYINLNDPQPYKVIERSIYLRMLKRLNVRGVELYSTLDDSIEHQEKYRIVGASVNEWYLEYFETYDLMNR